MVMGGGSCLRGHEFEFLCRILDRSSFKAIVRKNSTYVSKDRKEAGNGPFKKNKKSMEFVN